MKTMLNKLNRGFTILEMLLVIAIITVLFSIIIFSVRPTLLLNDTKNQRADTEASLIKSAIDSYKAFNGKLPDTFSTLDSGVYELCAYGTEVCPAGSIKLDELVDQKLILNLPIIDDTAQDLTGYNIYYNADTASVSVSSELISELIPTPNSSLTPTPNPTPIQPIISAGSYTFTTSSVLGSATTYENYDITVNPGVTLTVWGDHSFASVTVENTGIIDVGQYGESSDYERGSLNILANNVDVKTGGKINAAFRGFGGGGGGGGGVYADGRYCTGNGGLGGVAGSAVLEGVQGQNQNYFIACRNNGGAGGGYGGVSALEVLPIHCATAGGGTGGGNYGGVGGAVICGNNPGTWSADWGFGGGVGFPGGYLANTINGDTTTSFDVVRGSGGGGGAGGTASGGYCSGGGAGGAGGIEGVSRGSTCSGGFGGSGGAAGGGSVKIDGIVSIKVQGQIIADGAGKAQLNAGYGAGGGIALKAPSVDLTSATIRSLGGNMTGNGVTTNGGTVKVFYTTYTGSTLNTTNFPAGRVYSSQYTSVYIPLPTPTPTPVAFNPTSGLVAYYPFSEGSGITTDDVSANNNVGTLTNMDSASDWVTGKFGTGLDFDGVDDYISASLATTQLDNWTLSAWIYPNSISQLFGGIVYLGSGADGYGLTFGTTGSVGANHIMGLYNAVSWVDGSYTFPSASRWYHVVGVRENGIMLFYVDGTLRYRVATSAPKTPTLGANIGRAGRDQATSFFNGKIDEVRVYDKALSLAEVDALYNTNPTGGAAPTSIPATPTPTPTPTPPPPTPTPTPPVGTYQCGNVGCTNKMWNVVPTDLTHTAEQICVSNGWGHCAVCDVGYGPTTIHGWKPDTGMWSTTCGSTTMQSFNPTYMEVCCTL
ncbi:prepilin-type N-terminal cleavage/methylation domain-containing protein [Candidatus Dojkabacteria bacterium]|nr:prepilin-type N-terminal cleavage/methylation domain-containing protein [Candidatus Dojkabacteria bacterium]